MLKDVLILAGGVIMIADTAKQILRRLEGHPRLRSDSARPSVSV
ncbi:hypothetical protein [Pseudomonas silesiensis]